MQRVHLHDKPEKERSINYMIDEGTAEGEECRFDNKHTLMLLLLLPCGSLVFRGGAIGML